MPTPVIDQGLLLELVYRHLAANVGSPELVVVLVPTQVEPPENLEGDTRVRARVAGVTLGELLSPAGQPAIAPATVQIELTASPDAADDIIPSIERAAGLVRVALEHSRMTHDATTHTLELDTAQVGITEVGQGEDKVRYGSVEIPGHAFRLTGNTIKGHTLIDT